MASIWKSLDGILEIGERLHFFSAIASKLMGEKPVESDPTVAKGAYWLFGAGKDDERRVGAMLRAIKEAQTDPSTPHNDNYYKTEIFGLWVVWLTEHDKKNLLERVQAAMIRNALFVYIAKVEELTSTPEADTVTTTIKYQLPADVGDTSKNRTAEEKRTGKRSVSGRSSEAQALILEIVDRICREAGGITATELAKDENRVTREAAFRKTTEWYRTARGLPIRRVKDDTLLDDVSEWAGVPRAWLESMIGSVNQTVMPMFGTTEEVAERHKAMLERREQKKGLQGFLLRLLS